MEADAHEGASPEATAWVADACDRALYKAFAHEAARAVASGRSLAQKQAALVKPSAEVAPRLASYSCVKGWGRACSSRASASETLPDWEDGASSPLEGVDKVEELAVPAGPLLQDTLL